MSQKLHHLTLAPRYTATLRQYLSDQHEAALEQGYELGRAAIAEELGVLDLARLHHQAIEELLGCAAPANSASRAARLVGAAQPPLAPEEILRRSLGFFLESLSPFEVRHRGFSETNAQLAEHNRALEREVAERKRIEEDLRSLSSRLLHAQEEERKRISRELHDEISQALTALSVSLAGLSSKQAASHRVFSRKLARVQGLLQATMRTVHDFALELRPAMLDELGLLSALRSYLKGFAERTGLRVRFRASATADHLDSIQSIALFRVAQESLTNVARHAQARCVDISLRNNGEGICLEVADDGKSFAEESLDSPQKKQRLGLLGMQERVRLINGHFSLQARPGKGTTVRVEIPCNRAGEEVERLPGHTE